MSNDYKELMEKTFEWIDELKKELNYYFPEYENIYVSDYEEGCEKYSWYNYIILKYFGELYRINITSFGNGGWQSIDECRVTSIKKVKRIEEVITYTRVNYIDIE